MGVCKSPEVSNSNRKERGPGILPATVAGSIRYVCRLYFEHCQSFAVTGILISMGILQAWRAILWINIDVVEKPANLLVQISHSNAGGLF